MIASFTVCGATDPENFTKGGSLTVNSWYHLHATLLCWRLDNGIALEAAILLIGYLAVMIMNRQTCHALLIDKSSYSRIIPHRVQRWGYYRLGYLFKISDSILGRALSFLQRTGVAGINIAGALCTKAFAIRKVCPG